MSPSTPPGPPPTELKFFMISDPAEARTPGNKKLVRSHVARTSHARSRHARETNGGGGGSSSSGRRDPPGTAAGGRQPELPAPEGQQHVQAGGPQQWGAGAADPAAWEWASSSSPQPSWGALPEGEREQTAPQSLDPWEQYLLDYYVNVFNPCDRPRHPLEAELIQRGMDEFVAFCKTDAGLLTAIYMASCNDLSQQLRKSKRKKEADAYEQRALYYRGECIRQLYEAMPSDTRPVTDNVICMAVFMAVNDHMAGDYEEAKSHMDACEQMVEMKGGHHTLGLNGHLSQIIIGVKHKLNTAKATVPSGKGKAKSKK